MSKWTDRFNQHAVHNTLRTLQNLLIEINVASFKGQEDAFSSLERTQQVFELTTRRLETTDSNLVPTQTLNNLNSSFQTVTNELTAFKSNKNIAHLVNANNSLDNILIHLSNLAFPASSIDFEAIREAASTYRRSVGQFLRSIDEESKGLKTKLDTLSNETIKLSNEVNSQKQRTDSIINTFQQQFSAAEDKRRTEFQSSESERKKKSETQVSQKEAEWSQIIKDKKLADSALLKKAHEAFDKLESDAFVKVGAVLEQMNKSKKTAEDLVGIITDTGMVGGYQRVANEEKKSARNWRKVALGSLVALVAFAVFAFIETLAHVIRWDQIAARVFVAVSFGILAAYAALQADKHERSERKNRKTELELASIIPYPHDLPQDKQHKIREELAMRMFGQAETVDLKTDKKTTGSILDVLKLAMEAIGNLAAKK